MSDRSILAPWPGRPEVRLRIAVVSKADSHGGGASRVAEELTDLLNAEGHQATHWAAWSGKGFNRCRRPLYGRSYSLSKAITLAHKVSRKVGMPELLPLELPVVAADGLLDCDVVHFHDISSAISPSTIWAIARRKPVAWTFHDCSPFTGGCLYPMGCQRFKARCGSCPSRGEWPLDGMFDFTGYLQDRKARLLASGLVTTVAPSEWMAITACESGKVPSRPRVISNGVDVRTFRPAEDKARIRSEIGLPLDRKVILLSAGGLSDPRKGVRHAIRAIQSVSDLKPFVLLVGDAKGLMRDGLDGLDAYEAGFIGSPAELARHYSAADLSVLCSLADNQPLAVLETMACGVPTVGFASGGMPEIVETGRTGCLVPTLDHDALSAALRRALTGDLTAWSSECRRAAEDKFSHQTFVSSHVSLYREMIASRHGAAISQGMEEAS